MSERVTVYPEGGRSLVLTGNDHLATGGEGSVYVKGDTAYKVYLEPAKAIRAGMERKVAALAAIKHPGIAAPQAILRDKNGLFIGLSLPKAPGEALYKAFTNSWRDTHQFGLTETAKVVEAMRGITIAAHDHQALMVDANEMNWLVHGLLPTAIDVDSWQLPGFPATAIMPSIRDYSQNEFSEGSDWFAWAVVTFQLWTGIHPYKGTHPDFSRGALEERMRSRASLFDSKVRLPPAARLVAGIPPALRAWYELTFATGERSEPPSTFASTLATQTAPRLRVRQTLAGSLKLERLGHAGDKILAAFNGFVVARGPSGLVLWDALAKSPVADVTEGELQEVLRHEAAIVRTAGYRVVLRLRPGVSLSCRALGGPSGSNLPSTALRVWQSGNRVFALAPGVSNGLVEVDAAELGGRLVLAVRQQWPAAILSTSFFRGGFVQDCLGMPFVGVLEGDGVLQGPAEGLKGYKVAEGFGLDRSNVWLTAVRRVDGETVRLSLAFKAGRWAVEEVVVVATLGVDAAASSSGVGVLREEDALVVAKGAARKQIDRSGLAGELRLFSLGAGIGAFEDGEVMKLSLS
ncbi:MULTISPECIES: hypothetical protein [unclassified Variovorax]|uniref:hypothetical protein n=1 Tax=unclassified Variovorax TaxID=663243 RepID=UPI001316A72B|nr:MULTISPECIES: hypothetical protein [unclassified Variovorax]VTU42534.1 hypothetical protein H6P1_00215 [Variovorax sp. PBL-H6]VTU43862.1 hypothetical protein SRS16P1_00687 [Variovorax sp. SRS16]VTU43926.1 hypothetical protein E5P1_00680 [Variovorax sp. PBL-E5]